MPNLIEREAQAKALAEGIETDLINPIEDAAGFPNRFETLSYFFPEGDGVGIVLDLDNKEEGPRVYYFHDEGREEITQGALYEWALTQYEEA